MSTFPSFSFTILVIFQNVLYAQALVEQRLASQVSQSILQETVHDLVRFGNRMGGTVSGDRSAEYILRKFRELGLEAEVVEDPEQLTFTNDGWLLHVDEPTSLRTLITNEWLSGFSPSAQLSKARVVYAELQQPTKEGMYDGLIVLTEHYVDGKLYQDLVKAGAVCILSYAPGDEWKYSDWALITTLRSSTENPIPVFNISYRNGARLKAEVQQGTEILVSFMTKTTVAKGRPKTVVATLEGESDDYFIVCAHGDSDSGGPGADDNASGVVGVLEVARALNDLMRTKALARPKKSVKFIVWGSEYFSTQHFVQERAGSLEKILGVMNYDEIGTGAERNCIYFESNDVLHNEQLLRTLSSVAEDYVGKEGFWQEATTNPSQGGTDSYIFLPDYLKQLRLPEVKIPSVTIYTAAWDELKTMPQTTGWSSKAWKGHPDSVTIDYSRYYHSSLDVPSLTTDKEPFNMVWAVKAVGIALLRMAW